MLGAAADKFSINTCCWLWLSAEVSGCSRGAWGASGNNVKAEANPEESLRQLKVQSLCSSFMKISSQSVPAEPSGTQAAQLDLGFYPVGCIAICFKNIPKLCVCASASRGCTSVLSGHVVSGHGSTVSGRAVTNTQQLRPTEPAFGPSACASWLIWDSAPGRHSGTWLKEQPPTQLLPLPVPRKQRTLQSFIQTIKCSLLRQTHQPISFPVCIKRITVLRPLVRGATWHDTEKLLE